MEKEVIEAGTSLLWYVGFITTANFAAMGGLYKLLLSHLTNRDIHKFCSDKKHK